MCSIAQTDQTRTFFLFLFNTTYNDITQLRPEQRIHINKTGS